MKREGHEVIAEESKMVIIGESCPDSSFAPIPESLRLVDPRQPGLRLFDHDTWVWAGVDRNGRVTSCWRNWEARDSAISLLLAAVLADHPA